MIYIRNPNGYGSVVKLSGNRRRPYVVRKTVGYDDRAYPIYAVIGYYQTRTDAMIALAAYNNSPYNLEQARATFSQVYELWSKEQYPKMGSSLKAAYTAAYKHCEKIYDVPYKALRKRQMQDCIDSCGRGYHTKANIKLLFGQLDSYAYDLDIISKQYSKSLDIGEKEASTKHTVFADAEVMKLWKIREKPFVDEALFLLYTGCRVSEMLKMKSEDVHIDDDYMVGGVKTENGKNRVIPIHPDIKQLVKEHLSDNEYLFNLDKKQGTKSFAAYYGTQWAEAMKKYGIPHLTHDCRHTVRSKLDSAGANKVAIDRIIGHSSNSIGERVYTHKTIEELKEALFTLSYGVVS